jgi:hypothetical protein
MNNYKNFKVKDWVDDPDFRKWVYKGERDAFWLSVLENTPSQVENMEQAKEILLSIRGEVNDIPEQELASRKEICWITFRRKGKSGRGGGKVGGRLLRFYCLRWVWEDTI